MIPEIWLKERLETTDFQEIFRRELASSGLSEADMARLLAQGPSPLGLGKWRDFIGQMIAGDELWFFKSPPETWRDFAGRAGYVLVRSGRIVASFVSMKN